MLVGSIGYDCASGLGHLNRDFYLHGVTQKVMVNRQTYPSIKPPWLKPEDRYEQSQGDKFLEGLDCLLLYENAFQSWGVVKDARRRGVKIILCPNYEWTEQPSPVEPDIYLCPSSLDMEYFVNQDCRYPPNSAYRPWDVRHGINGSKAVFTPIPVDKPWRLREKAEVFVHNAGHGQHLYGKGTPEVIEAMEHVKSPVNLIVRGQPSHPRIRELFQKHVSNPRVELDLREVPEEELFATGDVYINAEKLNGLSLPLQEAWASGMLVMTTDRFPANSWLPKNPLIPVKSYAKGKLNHTEIDIATVDPKAIAAKVDEWYGKSITEYSLQGKKWAEDHSWSILGPKYLKLLEALHANQL